MTKAIRMYFLCVQNRCRSQIAEGFARHFGGDLVIASSAGIEEGEIHSYTIEVMKEVGIDITSHYSKKIDMKTFMNSDIVIKTCNRVNEQCPIVPFGIQSVQWEIPDPIPKDGTLGNIDDFRKTRDLIRDEIVQLLKSKQIIVHET